MFYIKRQDSLKFNNEGINFILLYDTIYAYQIIFKI
jgi:hypothetical protein